MKRVRLKEYCYILRGKEPGSNAYGQGNIPFIRVGTLSNSKNIVYVAENSKFTYVNKSDLLFSTDGSPGIVKMGFEGYISSGIVKIEPKNPKELNLKYLFYFLKTNQVQQIVKECSKGTTIKHASSCLDKIEIPLPSIEEQERIVAILDQVYENIGWDIDVKITDLKVLKKSAIDKAIRGQLTAQNPLESAEDLYKSIQEEKENLIKEGKIKKYKKEEIKPISEDEIPFEIPKNWKWCRVSGIISSISSGKSIDKNLINLNSNYKVLGGNGVIGKTHEYNCSEKSLVIGRVGCYCGNIRYLNEKIYVTDNAFILKTYLNYKYLYYTLTHFNLNKLSKSTAQPVINTVDIKNVLVPLPPLEEQERIVEILSAIDDAIDDAIAVREDNKKLLNSLLNKYLNMEEGNIDKHRD